MPINTDVVASPGWWLARLTRQLQDRRLRLDRLDRYYRGDADLPYGSEAAANAFRSFQRMSRTNWAGLIVEATRERMRPTGFRTGVAGDDNGDEVAFRIWQANGLDADAPLVHRAMLSMGDGYVIVGDVDPDLGVPLITPEDPRQVITAHDPRRRRKVTAALKLFADDVSGDEVAYVYLPGEVWRARRTPADNKLTLIKTPVNGWEWDAHDLLPIDDVPVVRFPNRANLAGQSMGEFEDVLDHIDRINDMVLERVSIAKLQAFRQRAIKGIPVTDAEGRDIDYSNVFAADPGALWQLPDDAEIWESGQVDLTPILESVKADVRDLAAVTKVPMFYLFPDAANGSAEGASLQREGLVFKVADRIEQTSEAWERVMSLAFGFAGDRERASLVDMETLWQPPERFSLAERYDANSKATDVPWRSRMSDILQFSPQQVARMEAERVTDAFLTMPAPPAQVP